MGTNKILLDTDVIINILKKKEDTIKKLYHLQSKQLYISPIVIAEIYAGIRAKELEQVETLLGYFVSIEIDDETAIIAGNYANRFKKAYQGISLEDYLIAATAKQHNLQLWTYNKKHYPMDDIVLV